MKKALSALALLSVTVLPATVSGAATTTSPALAALNADQVASLSLANATKVGVCTSSSLGRAAGYQFNTTTYSGARSAQQTLSVNKATGVARLVNGVLYVRLSAKIIDLQFAKNDPRYANTWISIPSTDKQFPSISSGLLFSSMLSQVRPAGHLTKTPVTVVDGVSSLGLSGLANAELGLTSASETLYVSVAAPHLPVELLAAGRSQGVPTTLVVTFTRWGQHLDVAVPPHALPISSTTLN
jgi:hypothetical protein